MNSLTFAVVGAALLLTYATMWSGFQVSGAVRARRSLTIITNIYRWGGLAALATAVALEITQR